MAEELLRQEVAAQLADHAAATREALGSLRGRQEAALAAAAAASRDADAALSERLDKVEAAAAGEAAATSRRLQSLDAAAAQLADAQQQLQHDSKVRGHGVGWSHMSCSTSHALVGNAVSHHHPA